MSMLQEWKLGRNHLEKSTTDFTVWSFTYSSPTEHLNREPVWHITRLESEDYSTIVIFSYKVFKNYKVAEHITYIFMLDFLCPT